MNYETNTKKKRSETGTGTRPEIEPPPQPPAQHAGPSKYRKTSTQRKALDMINNTVNRPNPDNIPKILGTATNEDHWPPPLPTRRRKPNRGGQR